MEEIKIDSKEGKKLILLQTATYLQKKKMVKEKPWNIKNNERTVYECKLTYKIAKVGFSGELCAFY